MGSAFPTKIFYAITASVLLAVCFVQAKIPLLHSFLHELINVFAGGRSGIKITLFILLLCAIGLLNLNFQTLRPKISSTFLLAWLGITYAYTFLLQLYFIWKYNFRFADFVITFNNSEVSSTRWLHTHVAKGAMANLLNLFHIGGQENMDTGLAFIGLVPQPLLWLTLLLLAASIIIFLLFYKQRFASQNKWNIFIALAYSIVAFSLLKNLIDGGLFNRETLIALSGLLLLILPKEKLKWILLPILAYIAVLTVSLSTNQIAWAEARYNLLMGTIFLSVVVTLWYWWQAKAVNLMAILLIVFSCSWLIFPAYAAIGEYTANHKQLPLEGFYVALYESIPGSEPVESIGNLKIYEIKNQTVNTLEVMGKYHLLGNLQPVMSPWQTCIPSARLETYTFDLVSPHLDQLHRTQYKFGNISKINGNHIMVTMHPCAPRPLNIIQELLNSQIPQPYYILNLEGKEGI